MVNELADHYTMQTTTLKVFVSTMNESDLVSGTNVSHDNQTTPETAVGRMPFQLNEGILSKEDYDVVRDVRSKLGLPLSLSGCILNVVAVIVYIRMPPSFVNRYLIGLQILDTLFLLCTLYPFFLILICGPSAGHTRSYQYYAMYVNNYLYPCFQRTSVFCTAVLSINRCVVMLAPFNQFVKKVFKHPARIIITTQIVVCISSVYSPFKVTVVRSEMPDGSERYTLINSPAFLSNKELFDSILLGNYFVFSYIPAITSFVANLCMIVGLVVSSRRKRNADNPEGKKFFKLGNNKTLLVLVYSGVSLILLMPFMSIPLLKKTVPGFGILKKEHYMVITMGSISALCDIVRSAMGFFVFLGLSKVFRETLFAILLRKEVDKTDIAK